MSKFDMSAFSEMTAAKAFVAANGEFAWRRQDIEPVLDAIRDSGRATLGGEVWLIIGEHSWDGLIPSLDDSPPGVWHWETKPRSTSESWQQYCARTATESLEAVREMRVEQETPFELIDRLRFNVTYVAEPKT
ncbi:MAG: hypothetical protein K8U03_08595 [Planctomycetia bacterium]|nr:hypothetical protein [Planctomycetia bacterium]